MPKLPDKSALGGAGSLATGDSVVTGSQYGAGVVGGAIEKAADVGLKVVDEQIKERDTLEVIKAEALRRPRMMELENQFDRDNDHATFDQRFSPAAKAIDDEAAAIISNPQVRERFRYKADLETSTSRNRVLDKSTKIAKQQAFVDTDEALRGMSGGYADPRASDEQREATLREMEGTIRLAQQRGLVDPLHASHLEKSHIYGNGGILYREAENRLWDDPYGTLADLRAAGRRTPSGPADADFPIEDISGGGRIRAQPRKGAVEGVIVHHTAGSSLEGALAHGKATGTGANYYIDRDGTVKRAAPDDRRTIHIQEPGHPARTDTDQRLRNDNTIGIEVIAKDDDDVTPQQRAALDRLLGRLETTHKLKPENIVGHGEIQGGEGGNRQANEGSAAAKAFRERDRTAPDPEPADPNDRIPDIGAGEPSAAARRYARMSPEARAALITRARTAMSDTLQRDLRDAAAETARTGQLPADEQGRTALDRAARILSPNQLAKAKRAIDEAQMGFKATAPMPDMTEDQVMEHLDKLAPAQRAAQGEGYAAAAKVQERAWKSWERIKDLRSTDPVKAISGGTIKGSGAPTLGVGANGEVVVRQGDESDLRLKPAKEVQLALEQINGAREGRGKGAHFESLRTDPIKARGLLLEARLAAQQRLGVVDPKLISREEGDALLRMPKATYKDLDSKQYRDGIKAAADRFVEFYGPQYAKRAFSDALAFHLSKQDDIKAQDRVIAKAISSVVYSPERQGQQEFQREMNRAKALTEIDRTGQLFEGGGEPAQRPAPAPTPAPRSAAPPTPSEEDITFALAKPSRQQRFDKEFGEGAYARELAKRQKPKPEKP